MKNKGLYLVLVMTVIQFHLSMGTPWKEMESMSSDVESEFLFGSHVARMLYDVSQSTSGRTGNSNNQAVNCPQSNGYRSCLPSQNGGGANKNCDDYTRNCWEHVSLFTISFPEFQGCRVEYQLLVWSVCCKIDVVVVRNRV